MKWESKRYTPWKTKIAWIPMKLEDTWIWLERYERCLMGGCRTYRLPGSERTYQWYP